jgi:hypothetical protein
MAHLAGEFKAFSEQDMPYTIMTNFKIERATRLFTL